MKEPGTTAININLLAHAAEEQLGCLALPLLLLSLEIL